MADFCKQCSMEVFGEDMRDLAGLISSENAAQGMVAIVMCEGCGPAEVDNDGVCKSKDCDKCHGAEGRKHG